MRVAVSQFATSSNVQENLASCIRLINEAATCKPCLIVLPEYCNTLFCDAPLGHLQLGTTPGGYVDHNQAWNDALAINGEFLQAIAAQAIKHCCYIVLTVTMQRDLLRNHQDGAIKSNISVTTCLFSPVGERIYQADKKTLTVHENEFFINTAEPSDVVTTPFGKLGLLTGSDSMNFKVSRDLALGGAQLLCNSINTFTIDQSKLHDPARSFENNVFLATANKVGALVSKEQREEYDQAVLVGSGQSQIISNDGKVLAKITHHDEGFVFADIDLSAAGLNNKVRPDNTQVITQLRPKLYQASAAVTKQAHHNKQKLSNNASVPITANVAIFATYAANEKAIEDVCQYIENNLSDIIQLPELFFVADKNITHDTVQLSLIETLSKQVIAQVSAVLRPFQYLCTSLVIDGIHQAVLISEQGVLATQQQLHFCQRYQWTALGNGLTIIELPLEQGSINMAMLTADDANIPEIVNIAALRGIHLLLVPFDIQEPCEVANSLLSRAAENRVCIVAASREKSFANNFPDNFATENSTPNIYSKNKVKALKSTGLIANLTTEPTLLPQWKSRQFTGYINQPLVKLQYGKITKAVIHPIAACNKTMAAKPLVSF